MIVSILHFFINGPLGCFMFGIIDIWLQSNITYCCCYIMPIVYITWLYPFLIVFVWYKHIFIMFIYKYLTSGHCLQECVTRWRTRCKMMQRSIEQERAISQGLSRDSNAFIWNPGSNTPKTWNVLLHYHQYQTWLISCPLKRDSQLLALDLLFLLAICMKLWHVMCGPGLHIDFFNNIRIFKYKYFKC